MYFHYTVSAVVIGVLLDFIIGDPHGLWHPVMGIGKLINGFEKIYRKLCSNTAKGKRCAGVLLWISVMIVSGLIPATILILCYMWSKVAYVIIASIMSCQIMATKSLKVESMKVYKALKEGDLDGARYAVSMIVGRDTDKLTEIGVTKAAVETIGENTSDGSIAPLFYLFVGGPILGFMYKAVNTMDSMIGYKNDKYIDIGRFAAKMDDIWNYIPARLAALNMVISAAILKMSAVDAWRIHRRDRYKSPSPNSAQTESVMAGALGIELLGDAIYFGEVHHKETIGDANRAIETEDIRRANNLMYGTVIVTLVSFMILYVLIIGILKCLI